MSLANGLSFIYLIKEPAFTFVDFCCSVFCLFFIYFCSNFYDFFPSTNPGVLHFFFFVDLAVKLGYLFDFLLFLEVSLYCYEPSLSTAFTESHRFWVLVFSFSFVFIHILISFLTSSVICWLFRSMLFSLHMFVFLIVSFFSVVGI